MSSVDVIVPCYNYGRYLRECVESVLAQEGVEVRVLIIDDCSTDDSETVGRQLATDDPRVEFRRQKSNVGHIATYNVGLAWVTAEYSMLLSADDVLPAGALGRATRLLDNHPSVAFAYGRHLKFSDASELCSLTDCDPRRPVTITPGREWIDQQCRAEWNPVASGEVVVRSRLQRDVGDYSAGLPHTADLEQWLRFAARGDIGYIDEIQVYYRRHDQNMSDRLAESRCKDLTHLHRAFQAFFDRDRLLVRDAERLSRQARENIANHALGAAYKAFWMGDRQECHSLMRLAAEVRPDVPSIPLYGRLQTLLWIGLGPARLGLRVRRLLRAGRRAWLTPVKGRVP